MSEWMELCITFCLVYSAINPTSSVSCKRIHSYVEMPGKCRRAIRNDDSGAHYIYTSCKYLKVSGVRISLYGLQMPRVKGSSMAPKRLLQNNTQCFIVFYDNLLPFVIQFLYCNNACFHHKLMLHST